MRSFLRPKPLQRVQTKPISARHSPTHCAKQLVDGKYLTVSDHYRTGLIVLEELQSLMSPPKKSASHPVKRQREQSYRNKAAHLLVRISNHQAQLDDTAPIGFLKTLYPDTADFWLPFVELQELFGAWRRYTDGHHLAVLGHRLHPFYGTYVPTRTEHLELFATWLHQYNGLKKCAIDVGTGSGVLAFLLAKCGFAHIIATDNNPNAVESVKREIKRHDQSSITPQVADLFDSTSQQADVIVFNPPWMFGNTDSLIDRALYFQGDLFPQFFERAKHQLRPDGQIVLLFSNIMSLVQPKVPHPIQREIDRGILQLVDKRRRKVKPSAGHKRTREKVELWILRYAT